LLSLLLPQNLPRKKKPKNQLTKLKQKHLPQRLRLQNLPLLPQHQQRLPKVSLLRRTHLKQTQKPQRQPLSNRSLDDNDDPIVDDEITFGRNRRSLEFGQLVPNDELSDYVKNRLWLARMLALKKRQEVWG
jgi:hypothetical protein